MHFPRGLRSSEIRHTRQLHDPIDASSPAIMSRSVFGMIYTYNLLPQYVVDRPTVSEFQGLLQKGLLAAIGRGIARWEHLFSEHVRGLHVRSFQSLF